MTAIAIILAAIFLDGVWRIVVIGGLLLFEAFEITLWLRWRKRRSTTGAETIVGTQGIALTDCRPEGQVKVRGQIWTAHSSAGVFEGDPIEVIAVDGIKLEVKTA